MADEWFRFDRLPNLPEMAVPERVHRAFANLKCWTSMARADSAAIIQAAIATNRQSDGTSDTADVTTSERYFKMACGRNL